MRYSVLRVLITIGLLGVIASAIGLGKINDKIGTYHALATAPSASYSRKDQYQDKLDSEKKNRMLLVGSLIASGTLAASCIYFTWSGRHAESNSATFTAPAASVTASLKELNQLKSDGLITDEEYAEKRKKILSEL